MRPLRTTAAHKTDALAELVCSNSFRSDDRETQRGRPAARGDAPARLADHALRPTRTRCRPAARSRSTATASRPPSRRRSRPHPLIEIRREEIAAAAGGLGQRHRRDRPPHLAGARRTRSRACTGEDALAFFDAIAPIVHRDSIDMSVAWFQSRYDKAGPGGSGADYINCPLTREQYDAFVDALLAGDKTAFHEWEARRPISTAACRSR